MNCDPAELARAAACFNGIANPKAVEVYLTCAWAQVSAGCGTPSNFIQVTGAGDAAANQAYTWDGFSRYVGQTDGAWSIGQDLQGGWHIYLLIESHYTAVVFPCTWAIVGGDLGGGPAPTGSFFNGSPFPCGAPSNTIQISGAGSGLANDVYTLSSPNVFSGSFCTIGLQAGNWQIVNNFTSLVLYSTDPTIFPCTWNTEPDGLDPAPTGQYI